MIWKMFVIFFIVAAVYTDCTPLGNGGVLQKRVSIMDAQIRERDAVLLGRVRNGDNTAFDTLVLLYSAKLYHVAYMLLENKQDSEEVVQDAFIRAYSAIKSFRGDSSFETWMHRITLNLARNRFHWNRRRGAGVNVSLSAVLPGFESMGGDHDYATVQDWDLPDTHMQPDQELEENELEQDLSSMIDTLPEKFRESLLLRHEKEMSYNDIAQKTGVPINTVKTRIKRARELLREGLAARSEK